VSSDYFKFPVPLFIKHGIIKEKDGKKPNNSVICRLFSMLLFTCNTHLGDKYIRRTESGETGGNATLKLVAKSRYIFKKIEEIAGYGK
jgi:hypothetical protein